MGTKLLKFTQGASQQEEKEVGNLNLTATGRKSPLAPDASGLRI